jgi:hypothetical protein
MFSVFFMLYGYLPDLKLTFCIEKTKCKENEGDSLHYEKNISAHSLAIRPIEPSL